VRIAAYRYGAEKLGCQHDNQGQLTGITTENGTAVANVKVLLYNRQNGRSSTPNGARAMARSPSSGSTARRSISSSWRSTPMAGRNTTPSSMTA
jgi:hypothetical protein